MGSDFELSEVISKPLSPPVQRSRKLRAYGRGSLGTRLGRDADDTF